MNDFPADNNNSALINFKTKIVGKKNVKLEYHYKI